MTTTSSIRHARKRRRCDVRAEYSACTGSIEPGQVYQRLVAFPNDVVDQITVVAQCSACLDATIGGTPAENERAHRLDEQEAIDMALERDAREYPGTWLL